MSANATTKCSQCGVALEDCACCDEPGCPAAMCYKCLNAALGQAMPLPHAHGG